MNDFHGVEVCELRLCFRNLSVMHVDVGGAVSEGDPEPGVVAVVYEDTRGLEFIQHQTAAIGFSKPFRNLPSPLEAAVPGNRLSEMTLQVRFKWFEQDTLDVAE